MSNRMKQITQRESIYQLQNTIKRKKIKVIEATNKQKDRLLNKLIKQLNKSNKTYNQIIDQLNNK